MFSPAQVEALKVLSQEIRCSVCIEVFKEPQTLPCGHVFCKDCIIQSLRIKSECPLCKAPTWKRQMRTNTTVTAIVEATQRVLAEISVPASQASQMSWLSQGESVDQMVATALKRQDSRTGGAGDEPAADKGKPAASSDGKGQEESAPSEGDSPPAADPPPPSLLGAEDISMTPGGESLSPPQTPVGEVDTQALDDIDAALDADERLLQDSRAPATKRKAPGASDPVPVFEDAPPAAAAAASASASASTSAAAAASASASASTSAASAAAAAPSSGSRPRKKQRTAAPAALRAATANVPDRRRKSKAKRGRKRPAKKTKAKARRRRSRSRSVSPAPPVSGAAATEEVFDPSVYATTAHLPPSRRTSNLVFVSSNLSAAPALYRKLDAVAKLLGARCVNEFNDHVTHVICHPEGERECKRTLKYLLGSALGCWVVTSDWLDACLKSKARVSETGFEVMSCRGFSGGCRRLRVLRETGTHLLSGQVLHFPPAAYRGNAGDYELMARLAGATVTKELPHRDTVPDDTPRAVDCSCGQMVLVEPRNLSRRTIACQDCRQRVLVGDATLRDVIVIVPPDGEGAMTLRTQTHREIAKSSWLVESLSAGRALPITNYSFRTLYPSSRR